MDIYLKAKETAVRVWRENRLVFITSAVSGLLSYGFFMFNILHNWDSIVEWTGGYGTGIESGRWLLQLIGELWDRIWGNYTPPLLTIAVTILLLSLSACLINRLLPIKSKPLAALASAVFISFPTVGCTMIYTFTAHFYAFAVLLAVAGVYVTVRYRYGGFAGMLLFACSMGIYQAYMPLAASLFVLVLISRAASSDDKDGRGARGLVFDGTVYLLTLIFGFVLYFLILKLSLSILGAELLSYQGVDTMGINIRELPAMLARAYGEFFLLPDRPVYGVNDTGAVRLAIRISYDVSAAMLLYYLAFGKSKASNKILTALLFALFPLAVNSIVLLSYHSYVHLLMVYAVAAVFFLPAVMYGAVKDSASAKVPAGLHRALSAAAAVLIAASMSVASLNYIWQNNGCAMTLYFSNVQATEYFSTVVTRVKSTPGYRDDLKFAIVGDEIDDASYTNLVYEELPFHYSGIPYDPINIYSRVQWMYYYLGFDPVYATEAESRALRLIPEIADMPRYPDDGSIVIFGDYVVLRIDDADE